MTTWKKELNGIEMKSSYNTCEKFDWILRTSFTSFNQFLFLESSEYEICIINFGFQGKRYDFEIFCFSWSCQI